MIISPDTERELDKIQHLLLIKTQQTRNRKEHPHPDKRESIKKKPYS